MNQEFKQLVNNITKQLHAGFPVTAGEVRRKIMREDLFPYECPRELLTNVVTAMKELYDE